MLTHRPSLVVLVMFYPISTASAQVPPPTGAKLPLKAALLLTPGFCAAEATSVSGKVEIGAMACSGIEASLRGVFSSLSRITSTAAFEQNSVQVLLSPEFPGSPEVGYDGSTRELVVSLQWTARDRTGRILWRGAANGSGRATSMFVRSKKKDRNRLGEAAVKAAIERSPAVISSAAELSRLVQCGLGCATPDDVKALLREHPASVFVTDGNRNTPLHWAAIYGYGDVAEMLIAAKADVNAKDKNESTPLHLAAGNGSAGVVKALLAAGAEPNAKDKHGSAPLHSAAFSGSKFVAELLLSSGASVSARNDQGVTPLHIAAQNGFGQVVKSLVAAGAEVNAKDGNGSTPLHYAAYGRTTTTSNGQVVIVQTVWLAGIDDTNADNKNSATTPHGGAFSDANREVLEFLLANKADVNAKNNDGATPLHLAAITGRKDAAALLRQHGGHE